jgi:hypothetical protein
MFGKALELGFGGSIAEGYILTDPEAPFSWGHQHALISLIVMCQEPKAASRRFLGV